MTVNSHQLSSSFDSALKLEKSRPDIALRLWYTRKNLKTCQQAVNKLCSHNRTVYHKLSTSRAVAKGGHRGRDTPPTKMRCWQINSVDKTVVCWTIFIGICAKH